MRHSACVRHIYASDSAGLPVYVRDPTSDSSRGTRACQSYLETSCAASPAASSARAPARMPTIASFPSWQAYFEQLIR